MMGKQICLNIGKENNKIKILFLLPIIYHKEELCELIFIFKLFFNKNQEITRVSTCILINCYTFLACKCFYRSLYAYVHRIVSRIKSFLYVYIYSTKIQENVEIRGNWILDAWCLILHLF